MSSSTPPHTRRLYLPPLPQKVLNNAAKYRREHPDVFVEPPVSEHVQQRIDERIKDAIERMKLLKKLKTKIPRVSEHKVSEYKVAECTKILEDYVDNTNTEGGGNNYKGSKHRVNRTRHRVNRTRHRVNRTRHRVNRTRHRVNRTRHYY